jgi:hypothetical protein
MARLARPVLELLARFGSPPDYHSLRFLFVSPGLQAWEIRPHAAVQAFRPWNLRPPGAKGLKACPDIAALVPRHEGAWANKQEQLVSIIGRTSETLD